jgi:hypothetical protein
MLTRQWEVSALRACKLLDTLPATPQRTWLFHDGPSGPPALLPGSWQIMSSLTFLAKPVASRLAPLRLSAAKILQAARLMNEARRQRDLLGLTLCYNPAETSGG